MFKFRLDFAVAIALAIAVPRAVLAQQSTPPADAPPPAPPPAAEPSPDDIAKAKQHYIKGAELVEAEDHANAVNEFKESYRLSKNPLLLYNIGWTYDEIGDTNLALFYYEKFLSQAPDNVPNYDVAKDRVRALKRNAEADAVFDAGARAKQRADRPAAEASRPAGDSVDAFQHRVVDEAPPGKPLDLTAMIPDGADWQLQLFFRAPGQDAFTAAPMRQRYNEWVGRIPPGAMTGTTVQYYIEVKDRSGKVIERVGRSTSPNIVFIDASARPSYYPDFGDDTEAFTRSPSGGNGEGIVVGSTGDGYFDAGSTRFDRVKWTSTGLAAGMLTTALVSWFVAADAASTVEGDAFNSNAPNTCPDGAARPCTNYGEFLRDTEDHGQRWQTIYRVTMGVGMVAGGIAGYYWYKDVRDGPRRKRSDAVTVVPVIGDDVIGGAASIEF